MLKEVIAMIGGAATVYLGYAPRGAKMPYVIANLITENSEADFLNGDGATEWSFQIDVYAKRYSDALVLSDVVRSFVHRPGQNFIAGGYRVHYCRVESVEHNSETGATGSEETEARITIELNIRTSKEV